MRQRRLLRVGDVLQQRAGGGQAELAIVTAEAGEIARAELLAQQAPGAVQLEMPRRAAGHPCALWE